MKNKIKLILTLLTFLVTGCSEVIRAPKNNRLIVTGSGSMASQVVMVAEFNQIEAALPFKITINQGEVFSIVLTSDDNFIEFLQVEQSDRTIHFGFKPGYAYDISGVTLQAAVTMPSLTGLRLSGSSHVILNNLQLTDDFAAELSGSSSLEGSLAANAAHLDVNGSAYVKLTGSSRDLWVEGCGNSLIDLGNFQAENSDFDINCSSRIIINETGQLGADALEQLK